ncbi:MAG: hypothetical protein ACRYFZ_04045 [Janthinobacterium lividum]
MKKHLCTLLCAAFVGLPSAGGLFASTPATHHPVVSPKRPQATRPQSMVQVTIALPYRGEDNYWDITFIDTTTGAGYTFSTSDGTAQSGILGNIPEGTYDVSFSQTHGHHDHFEFYVGCDQTRIASGTSETLYNRTIDSVCYSVIIDCTDYF